MREHLELLLSGGGLSTLDGRRRPRCAGTGWLAGRLRPDLVLADYNLPNGMNGVQVSQKLRQELDRQIPFIILTGDISTETLRDIALHDCVQSQQAGQVARADAGDRETPGEAARPASCRDRLARSTPRALPTRQDLRRRRRRPRSRGDPRRAGRRRPRRRVLCELRGVSRGLSIRAKPHAC